MTNRSKISKPRRTKDQIAFDTRKREESIQHASEFYNVLGMSIRQACLKLNANRTTVSRRLNGGKSHKQASQDNQYLTPQQEKHIVNMVGTVFRGNCPAIGKSTYRKLAQTIIDRDYYALSDKNVEHRHVSESWEHRLRQRQPELDKFKRNMKSYFSSRGKQEVYTKEFNNLKKVLEDHNITPDNFYSVGEMSIYDMNNRGVINAIGVDPVYREGFQDVFADEKKQNLVAPPEVEAMVFEACNAEGSILPSFVAFHGCGTNTLTEHWYTFDLNSDNHEAFFDWLKFFHEQTVPSEREYRVLYFGAHYFNLSIEVLEFAAEHRILFMANPPERNQVQPVVELLESMQTEILKEQPYNDHEAIMDAIQSAKSKINSASAIRAWKKTGLLETSSGKFTSLGIRSQSSTPAKYRMIYARENGYYFGKRVANISALCKICNFRLDSMITIKTESPPVEDEKGFSIMNAAYARSNSQESRNGEGPEVTDVTEDLDELNESASSLEIHSPIDRDTLADYVKSYQIESDFVDTHYSEKEGNHHSFQVNLIRHEHHDLHNTFQAAQLQFQETNNLLSQHNMGLGLFNASNLYIDPHVHTHSELPLTYRSSPTEQETDISHETLYLTPYTSPNTLTRNNEVTPLASPEEEPESLGPAPFDWKSLLTDQARE